MYARLGKAELTWARSRSSYRTYTKNKWVIRPLERSNHLLNSCLGSLSFEANRKLEGSGGHRRGLPRPMW